MDDNTGDQGHSSSQLLALLEKRGLDMRTAFVELLERQDKEEALRKTQPFRFMDLPPELRTRVYDCAFSGLVLRERLEIPPLLHCSSSVRAEASLAFYSSVELNESNVVHRIRHLEIFLVYVDASLANKVVGIVHKVNMNLDGRACSMKVKEVSTEEYASPSAVTVFIFEASLLVMTGRTRVQFPTKQQFEPKWRRRRRK
ncbi:hypothetical protein LTR95_013880 [Oleoguttula sp. CCFEE 5521]